MSTVANPLAGQIDEARKQGYSDDEITSYLSSQRADLAPKIHEAASSGYSPTEIVSYLHDTPVAPTVPGMEKLGGTPPGLPSDKGQGKSTVPGRPTTPYELQTEEQQGNPFLTSPNGLIRGGIRQAVHGAEQMAEPDNASKYSGASDILRGTARAISPAVIGASLPAAITTPGATAGAMALGGVGAVGGSQLGQGIAAAEGGSPEAQQLAGDVGAIGGGAALGALGSKVGGFVQRAFGTPEAREAALDAILPTGIRKWVRVANKGAEAANDSTARKLGMSIAGKQPWASPPVSIPNQPTAIPVPPPPITYPQQPQTIVKPAPPVSYPPQAPTASPVAPPPVTYTQRPSRSPIAPPPVTVPRGTAPIIPKPAPPVTFRQPAVAEETPAPSPMPVPTGTMQPPSAAAAPPIVDFNGQSGRPYPAHYEGHRNPTAAYDVDKAVIDYMGANGLAPTDANIAAARTALKRTTVKPADMSSVGERVRKTLQVLRGQAAGQ
jgi:hypothetical protein